MRLLQTTRPMLVPQQNDELAPLIRERIEQLASLTERWVVALITHLGLGAGYRFRRNAIDLLRVV